METSVVGPFGRFAVRHEKVHRWLRATEMAYYYAMFTAAQREPQSFVYSLFPKRRRPNDSLRHYWGRLNDKDGSRAPKVTLEDFRADIGDGLEQLFESVIVEEVGALEMFLRDWLLMAIDAALASRTKNIAGGASAAMSAFKAELVAHPRRAVSLAKAPRCFRFSNPPCRQQRTSVQSSRFSLTP